jgi:hypothetical protein
MGPSFKCSQCDNIQEPMLPRVILRRLLPVAALGSAPAARPLCSVCLQQGQVLQRRGAEREVKALSRPELLRKHNAAFNVLFSPKILRRLSQTRERL